MSKDWQEISVDFFRELLSDYLGETPVNFQKDTVIEVLDPSEEGRKVFLNNLSGLSKVDKVKHIKSVCKEIPEEFTEYLKETIGGVIQVTRKLPEDFLDLLGVTELDETNQKEFDSLGKLVLPIINEASFTIKLITSEPNSSMTPFWYKKENETIIAGDNLSENDWKLKESQRLVKIRVWSTEEIIND